MSDLPIQLEQLISFVDKPGAQPLHLVTDAVVVSGRVGELGDALVDHFVQRARAEGASWAEIGQSLGVSKQAAQKRFVTEERSMRGAIRGLFTRFSEEGRATVRRASGYAAEAGSLEVDTHHIVLALADEASGPAHQSIAALTGSAESVTESARLAIGQGSGPGETGHVPFGRDAKKVLELSLREAIRLGSREIGTGHILLGLLRDPKTPGARLLAGHGVTHEAVDQWLEQNQISDR